MNDHELDLVLDAIGVQRTQVTAPPALRERVHAVPVETPLRWSWLPHFHEGESTMFSALKFVAAGVIVALFGGFLLAGILTTPQGDDVAPAAVTEAPSPMTTEELLSGMVTEEVEAGVFRVDHDGIRDLSSADYSYVVVGQDGSIWLGSYSGDLSRLGVAGTHRWQLLENDYLMDFEVAPDGTVWAVVMDDEEQALRSFDGETWTTHRAADLPKPGVEPTIGDVEVAPDGVVWAALADGTLGYLDAGGSTWQLIEMPTSPWSTVPGWTAADEPLLQDVPPVSVQEFGLIATESGLWAPYLGGVWHYADGAWDHITYGGPDSGALRDEVFWGLGPGTGKDVILYRHDGAGWRQWSLGEADMLPGGWMIGPYAVAPDGSFWAGWPVGSEEDWNQGVSRFDGRTWVRFLPGRCITMAIAPDGSVWGLADDQEGRDLYVITPEAVQ